MVADQLGFAAFTEHRTHGIDCIAGHARRTMSWSRHSYSYVFQRRSTVMWKGVRLDDHQQLFVSVHCRLQFVASERHLQWRKRGHSPEHVRTLRSMMSMKTHESGGRARFSPRAFNGFDLEDCTHIALQHI